MAGTRAELEGRVCYGGLDLSSTTDITAFVLVYRLPSEEWRDGPDAPRQDAQRAMRLVRARALRYGYDAGRIGVIGYSAGISGGGRSRNRRPAS